MQISSRIISIPQHRPYSKRRSIARGATDQDEHLPSSSSCPFHSPDSPSASKPPLSSPSSLARPPGSNGLPLLGETIPFLLNRKSFLESRANKYGTLWSSNLLGRRKVFINSPQLIRKLLTSEHKLVDVWSPATFGKLLGRSFQGGKERHAMHRRVMGVAFSPEAMLARENDVRRLVRRRLENLSSDPQSYISGWVGMKDMAWDVAGLVVAGLEDEKELSRLKREYDLFTAGFRLVPPWPIPGTPFGEAVAAKQRITDWIVFKLRDRSVELQKMTATGREAARDSNLVIDLFLEAMAESEEGEGGEKMSFEDLVEITLFTLFAGQATTSVVLSHLLLHLHNNPEVLQRLRREQSEARARMTRETSNPPAASLLPYTEATIKEALRIAGTVQSLYRVALVDIDLVGTSPEGKNTLYRIDKGTNLLLQIGRTMREISEWLGDAGEFRPERWLAEDGGKGITPPPGYLPWGLGARSCLGMPLALMELRFFLTEIVMNYEWELLDPEERIATFHDHSPPKMLLKLRKNIEL